MKMLHFPALASSMLLSFLLTHVSQADEIKNAPATTHSIPNNIGHEQPAIQATQKPIANAWNWSGYLRIVQKTLPLGTPNRAIMDKVMEQLEMNKPAQAREYAIEEYKKNGDYSGLVSFLIGFMYSEGIGGDKDPVQGFNYMKLSALRGFPYGEHQLALYYDTGRGTPTNTLQAVLWYKAASLAGIKDATTNLKYIFIMEKAPDEWIQPRSPISEYMIREKLINARHFYRGYIDHDGSKKSPDLEKSLAELDDLVPNCVNPPQEQS